MYNFLLGATKNKDILFAEFETTTRNGYKEFSVSFIEVIPFNGDDFDLEEYYEDWIDSFDKADLYDLCERNWCAPQELPKVLAEDCVDVRDAMDCGLYPEVVEVEGVHYYFESSRCGQYDSREKGMDRYVNKEAYDLLHELWDEYHLKEIDEEGKEKMKKVIKLLEEVNEKDWIANYIQENNL